MEFCQCNHECNCTCYSNCKHTKIASVDTEVVKAGAGYSGHVHVELTLVRCLPMRLGARKCPVQAPACIGASVGPAAAIDWPRVRSRMVPRPPSDTRTATAAARDPPVIPPPPQRAMPCPSARKEGRARAGLAQDKAHGKGGAKPGCACSPRTHRKRPHPKATRPADTCLALSPTGHAPWRDQRHSTAQLARCPQCRTGQPTTKTQCDLW